MQTRALDELSVRASDFLDSVVAKQQEDRDKFEPARQGYELARWLRRSLSIEPDLAVDPASILSSWKVSVNDIDLETATQIDAIACWGKLHGPLILVNQKGNFAKDSHGRRSTLAHEIAHLLVDRKGALPLAEAIGGSAPKIPEQRARAFAAEFLVPQARVTSALKESLDIRTTVAQLRDHYRAGWPIVGWQIINGSAFDSLSESDRKYVELLVPERQG